MLEKRLGTTNKMWRGVRVQKSNPSKAPLGVDSNNHKKTRESNIELLKIFGILLITIQHSLTTALSLRVISFDSFSYVFACIFRYCGNLGNVIFIICSAYFLLDSKKSNKQKVLGIILDVFVISVIWIVPTLILNVHPSKTELVNELTPIIHGNNWFIGCYILLYLLHPLLNLIIDNISKKVLARTCLVSILLYSIVQFICGRILFFNELVFFVVLYFIVAYVKRYMCSFCKNKKANIIMLLSSTVCYLLMIIIPSILNPGINAISDNAIFWSRNIGNPFGIVIGISLFNLVKQKTFYNGIINYISSLSLLFYVFHENVLFRKYLRPKIYSKVLPIFGDNYVLWVIVTVLALFAFGMLSAAIYKETVQRITKKTASFVYPILAKHYIKIENKLIK